MGKKKFEQNLFLYLFIYSFFLFHVNKNGMNPFFQYPGDQTKLRKNWKLSIGIENTEKY